MKNILAKITFFTTISSGICFGQQSAITEDFKSSSLNQPQQEYPMVNSQGYARFKIAAPAADSVRVSLGLGCIFLLKTATDYCQINPLWIS